MTDLKKVLKDYFDLYNVDIDNSKVVIGVSTGVDSTVLLDLVMKYTKASIIVCHVNHGKREESIIEEDYINDFCLKNNLKYYCYHIKKEEIDKGNFQEEARKIRYKFFKSVMKEENASYLLLAHHLNDDIETMLMRMQRGSSLKGYAGISNFIKIEEGAILRPLLSVLKDDIIKYAKDNDIKYFEDNSNQTDVYTRNSIRHNIVPEIFKNISDATNNFLELKNNINNVAILLDHYRDNMISNYFLKVENGYKFSISRFKEIHEYIRAEIVFELCKKNKLSKSQVEEIIKVLLSDKANIKTSISGICIIKSYDIGYILDKMPEVKNIDILIDKKDIKQYDLGLKRILSVETKDCNKKNDCGLTNCDIMWYNSNNIPFRIRTWKAGDKIKLPFGYKKVSRVLIDKKVDIISRENVLVLEHKGTILAIIGYMKSTIELEKLSSKNNCDLKLVIYY